MLFVSIAITGIMGYVEEYNKLGDGKHKAIITSTDGSVQIKHEKKPEREEWGGGTMIVTETKVNGMTGHTTIHGNDDVNYHHPDDAKRK
jgi:hypothetical protein